MSKISDFQVGQWVVAMAFPGVPCQCNSQYSPEYPCRVLIEKVGRSKVHGKMTGSERLIPMKIPSRLDDKGLIAYPIDEAKSLYRKALEGRDSDRIEELVASL